MHEKKSSEARAMTRNSSANRHVHSSCTTGSKGATAAVVSGTAAAGAAVQQAVWHGPALSSKAHSSSSRPLLDPHHSCSTAKPSASQLLHCRPNASQPGGPSSAAPAPYQHGIRQPLVPRHVAVVQAGVVDQALTLAVRAHKGAAVIRVRVQV